MKTRFVLLLTAILLMLPSVTHAQFGAIRRAINRQVDHKIDSSLEKSAQDQRDKQAQEEQNQNGDDNGEAKDNPPARNKNVGLFGGKLDIKYQDNYDFTGRIHMISTSYEKKDEVKSDLYAYYNEKTLNAGLDLQTVDPNDTSRLLITSMIFDQENRAMMIMLGGDARIGTISTVPSDSALAAQAKANSEKKKQPTVTKTGKSRTIAGYRCDEYKVEDPDEPGYSNVWMTKDLKLKYESRYWGKSGMQYHYSYPGFEGMVMLAMEGYDRNDRLRQKIETVDINEHYRHSISTVGYAFSKVRFGQASPGSK